MPRVEVDEKVLDEHFRKKKHEPMLVAWIDDDGAVTYRCFICKEEVPGVKETKKRR